MVFRISRSGAPNDVELEVKIEDAGGTATRLDDYIPIGSTVKIPKDKSFVDVKVYATQDEETEGWDANGPGGESVKLTLKEGDNYKLGQDTSATAWIRDDTFTYTGPELAADATVAAAIAQAWANSNPNGPTVNKVEQGFWIYHNYDTSKLEVEWAVRDPATPPDKLLLPPIDTENGTRILVGWFHTHPFTVSEGYVPDEPSEADEGISTRNGIPGILKHHGGLEYFGPDESPDVIG